MRDFPTQAQVEKLRKQYPAGTKIKLDNMDDNYAVETGTNGIVKYVDDAGQLGMKWDNGRTLSLIIGIDSFHKISDEQYYNEKYPVLYSTYGDRLVELHTMKEVAEFICDKGKNEDLLIQSRDMKPFIKTIGIYLDKIADLGYRDELLKTLVPMQHQLEVEMCGYEGNSETDVNEEDTQNQDIKM